MKKPAIICGAIIGLLVIGLAFVFWPRTPRGEYRSERGMIYYFSDGVVAIDTSRSPHEFYIYANHPEDKEIEKVEIVDDGLHIVGPGIAEGAEEFMGAELSVGYSTPPRPGTVRVFENHGDWSEGRHVAIDPEAIREFVEQRDWNASVRRLWDK